jgi:hypothetical protein
MAMPDGADGVYAKPRELVELRHYLPALFDCIKAEFNIDDDSTVTMDLSAIDGDIYDELITGADSFPRQLSHATVRQLDEQPANHASLFAASVLRKLQLLYVLAAPGVITRKSFVIAQVADIHLQLATMESVLRDTGASAFAGPPAVLETVQHIRGAARAIGLAGVLCAKTGPPDDGTILLQ